ncbi:hypothetical protein [Vibrio sp. F74]|uniref:hypothetical protein n=1 Tax=Vibrio sp. F74 TaxID=700020 RepID=UPI0035F56DA9
MKSNNKVRSCHSERGSHRGHGWMMVICIILMIGIPLLILSTTLGSFSFSLLGTALIPIVFCLIMHGVMMKFMMSNDKRKEEYNNKKEHDLNFETKLVEHQSETGNQFKA